MTKKESKIAKLFFKKSLTKGYVDTQKVRQILKLAGSNELAHPTRVLKSYKRLIENALAKETIIVESASQIANEKKYDQELMSKTGATKVVHKINPQIVIGAKITHGDWIYDDTLDNKLNQLTA